MLLLLFFLGESLLELNIAIFPHDCTVCVRDEMFAELLEAGS